MASAPRQACRTSIIRTSAGRSRPTISSRLERTRLFEIFNGHPQVNGLGGGGVPSLEEMWDRVLSSGRLMYGLAVDDAHYFKRPGNDDGARPGRGWVFVRAPRLTSAAIVEALERGEFYSSTGVELADYQSERSRDRRRRAARRRGASTASSSSAATAACSTNRRLAKATYVIRGDEGYVRAKVIESNGRLAWTQPLAVGWIRAALIVEVELGVCLCTPRRHGHSKAHPYARAGSDRAAQLDSCQQ